MGKPNAEVKEDIIVGEPTEDRTIAEAGEELEVDTDAELEKHFPLHAVAYHFHTQIMEKPETDARVLAYARRGSTFRVSERVSKKGCAKGWHQIYGGGYICDGKGVNVAKEPITFEPSPPAPTLNASMPYEYKYVKRNGVAEFWKLPNAEEVARAESVFTAIDRVKSASEPVSNDAAEEVSVPAGDDSAHDDDGLARVLENAQRTAADADSDSAADNDKGRIVNTAAVVANIETTPAPPSGIATNSATETEEPIAEVNDENSVAPTELPPYVHLKMAKGYFVSVNKTVQGEGVTYQQTVRGRYIKADELYPAKPSEFEGVLLNDRVTLPIAFVVNGGTRMLKRQGVDGPLKNGDRVERYDHYSVRGTISRGSRDYVEVGSGLFLAKRAVGIASLVAPPENVGETERWIDVNLTEQTLVAYEGATPVFATLISSGRKDFETPVGEFRIYNKHVTITMDDPDGGEEAYSIEDVPWTQYFEEGYALHAAFWHDRFGRVRSHGCVNLSPADARRLFFWTGPHVNDGVHGVIATTENPGTRVVIHM
ncbi:MAG: L,D-transpeptidase [Deltaproteobacteria bacterium]|nr:L,D-transpeptidase [Deltaproteobacteria bacterium]MBN2674128.1 L,D-transpeptidase [Deltaproteobacteria bacterium]